MGERLLPMPLLTEAVRNALRRVLRPAAEAHRNHIARRIDGRISSTPNPTLAPTPSKTEEVFVASARQSMSDGGGSVDLSGGTFANLIGEPLFSRVGPEAILQGRCTGFFLVVMRGSEIDLDQTLRLLPQEWLQAVREKRAGLIFDHSREGTAYRNRRAMAWHAALKDLSLDPARVIYVTQNLHCQPMYERWAHQSSVSRVIHIFTYDYYIKRFFLKSWGNPAREYRKRKSAFLSRERIEKRFLSLNYKPRAWRIALLTRLLRDGLWSEGFVSFGGLEEDHLPIIAKDFVWKRGGPVSQFLELPISAETKDFVKDLASMQRIFFESKSSGSNDETMKRTLDLETDLFGKSAFSLVTETEMESFARRVTEKPFKALANCHPVILFGNYHGLELIRKLGFMTFDRWIDESYDNIRSPEDRFRSAYKAFRLFNQEAKTMVLQDKGLQDVLIYNLEHAMFGAQRVFSDTVDRKIHHQIRQAMLFAGEA